VLQRSLHRALVGDGDQRLPIVRGKIWRHVDLDLHARDLAVLARLTDEERRELHEIDAALGRIERAAFGQCELCGGTIRPSRLRAIPEARFCLSCAEERSAL
jgi:DnaK suppressor protein